MRAAPALCDWSPSARYFQVWEVVVLIAGDEIPLQILRVQRNRRSHSSSGIHPGVFTSYLQVPGFLYQTLDLGIASLSQLTIQFLIV